jgi:hypothetical protein
LFLNCSQNDVVIKPGEKAKVLMRGPRGEFELPFTEAVFGGPAKRESRGYWIKTELIRICFFGGRRYSALRG